MENITLNRPDNSLTNEKQRIKREFWDLYKGGIEKWPAFVFIAPMRNHAKRKEASILPVWVHTGNTLFRQELFEHEQPALLQQWPDSRDSTYASRGEGVC